MVLGHSGSQNDSLRGAVDGSELPSAETHQLQIGYLWKRCMGKRNLMLFQLFNITPIYEKFCCVTYKFSRVLTYKRGPQIV